jgi:hypothetical protein
VDDSNLPRELASRFVQLLKDRTATNDADEVRERFQKTYDLLASNLQSKVATERDAYFHALGQQLADPELPIWEFSCTANTCGIGVENGADPAYCIQPILDRLTQQLADCKGLRDQLVELIGTSDLEAIPEDQWDALANRSPEAAQRMREYLGIIFNGRAAMAMLARSTEARNQARRRPELYQNASNGRTLNRYAFYIAEVMEAVDGEDVVVIDLKRKIGFLTRLHAVRSNAHLFSLIQALLLEQPQYQDWTGAKPHPLLASIARCERMIDTISPEEWTQSGLLNEKGQAFDQGIWQFYQWPALQQDGTIETWAMAEPYHPWWVWGEMSPHDIVEIDGMKIILLGEPELPRQWEMGFFAPVHPALKPRVEIRSTLSVDSVNGWLDRIRAMPREKNPLPPVGAEQPAA